MRKSILFVTVLLAAYLTSNAKISRVGYSGTPLTGVDYSDFASAMNASSNGDTIQIYGSQYGGYTAITKRLVIMGFGYNTDTHSNLQINNTNFPTWFQCGYYCRFDPGSEGSKVEGLYLKDCFIATSDITISRCWVYDARIVLESRPINNVKFISCNLETVYTHYNTFALTNLLITNCLFFYIELSPLNQASSVFILNSNGLSGYNDTWGPYYNAGAFNVGTAGALVKNCIMYNYNSACPNTVYENNLFYVSTPSPQPLGSNNKWGNPYYATYNRLAQMTEDNIAANYRMWLDQFNEEWYTLKAGSPAINGGFDAANNPTDCGMFGGELAYRYKLGGLPAVPSIYKLSAPGSAAITAPYNITISAKSNN
jgi:hypothetical protein